MKITWKAFKQSWLEISLIVLVLVVAGVLAVFKPFDPATVGYFGDVATALLIGVAILLMLIGARRRVV